MRPRWTGLTIDCIGPVRLRPSGGQRHEYPGGVVVVLADPEGNESRRATLLTTCIDLIVAVSSPSPSSVGPWRAEAAVEMPVLNAHCLH